MAFSLYIFWSSKRVFLRVWLTITDEKLKVFNDTDPFILYYSGDICLIQIYGLTQTYTCTITYHSSLVLCGGHSSTWRTGSVVMMVDDIRFGLMNSRLLYPVGFLCSRFLCTSGSSKSGGLLCHITSCCLYSSAIYRIGDWMSDENVKLLDS